MRKLPLGFHKRSSLIYRGQYGLKMYCIVFSQEYNFSINSEWNGAPINHAPIVFQISAQDSRNVLVSVSGPFFNDPGPPPCAAGSACDGLWNYEGKILTFLRQRYSVSSSSSFKKVWFTRVFGKY